VTAPSEAHLSIRKPDSGTIRGRKPSVPEGVRPSSVLSRWTRCCGKDHLPARQIDQHLPRFIAHPIDQLVIGLVEVGEQAAIASANTGLPIAADEQRGVARCNRFINLVEVHQGQRFARDLTERLRVLDQTAQHAGATFCGFIDQDGATVIASRQRLAENFTLFQLEDDLDAPHEGVLNRRNRLGRIGRRLVETEEQRVLMVANDRDDPNWPHDVRRNIDLGIFIIRLRPVAAARINIETENGLICAPLQSLVDSADLGAVSILQVENRSIVAMEVGLGNLRPAVAFWPGKDGLNVEALTDALLVICGNPLGRRGLYATLNAFQDGPGAATSDRRSP